MALVTSLSVKVNTPYAPPCCCLINCKVDSDTHYLTETPVTEDNPKELALAWILGVTGLYKFEKKHFRLLGWVSTLQSLSAKQAVTLACKFLIYISII